MTITGPSPDNNPIKSKQKRKCSYTRPILRERHAKFHAKKTRKAAAPENGDDEPEQPTLF